MTEINAVFFDLDETLIENKLSVTDAFVRIYKDFSNELGHGKGSAFFEELNQQTPNLWEGMFDSPLTPERQLVQCFEHCIAAVGSVPQARHLSLAQEMLEHFIDLTSNNVAIRDSAKMVLKELHIRGYITGIITNGIERVQLSKIHKLRLHKKVNHIVVSSQAGAHKPMQEVFELALIKAGVAAEQAWHVGDHPTNDIAGAIRAGMGGIYYNPKHRPIENTFANLDERPTHTIDRLSEVLVLLSAKKMQREMLFKEFLSDHDI